MTEEAVERTETDTGVLPHETETRQMVKTVKEALDSWGLKYGDVPDEQCQPNIPVRVMHRVQSSMRQLKCEGSCLPLPTDDYIWNEWRLFKLPSFVVHGHGR